MTRPSQGLWCGWWVRPTECSNLINSIHHHVDRERIHTSREKWNEHVRPSGWDPPVQPPTTRPTTSTSHRATIGLTLGPRVQEIWERSQVESYSLQFNENIISSYESRCIWYTVHQFKEAHGQASSLHAACMSPRSWRWRKGLAVVSFSAWGGGIGIPWRQAIKGLVPLFLLLLHCGSVGVATFDQEDSLWIVSQVSWGFLMTTTHPWVKLAWLQSPAANCLIRIQAIH